MKQARTLVCAAALLTASLGGAHHSYALFDSSKTVTISGTAAKFDWTNPHLFIWVYVPDRSQKSGYELYAFESGSLVVMARDGWDRNTIRPGEKLTVEYFPLKDGRHGGSLIQVTHSDGRIHRGDPYGQQVIEQLRAKALGK
jgi:hypothetical protein